MRSTTCSQFLRGFIFMKNILQKTFGHEKRWVSWKRMIREGKPTKVPIYKNGAPASSTNPATWALWKDISAMEKKGIVFTPDNLLLGIDIDHCIQDGSLRHEKADMIMEFIIAADTYAEISPSNTGLHIFLKLSDPIHLAAHKKAPFECYSSGRFFTVTNNPFGEAREVRTVSSAQAIELLTLIGYPWSSQSSVPTFEQISVPDVLNDMFTSKHGDKIKKLYDGDTSDYNNDDSSADLSLCSHLIYWTRGNKAHAEQLWLASPLGQRQKTQKRKDYRERTLGVAMKSYTAHEQAKEKFEFLYMLKGDAKIITLNTENICRVLEHDPQFSGRFRYDSFKNTLEMRDGDTWREFETTDAIVVQTKISITYSFFQKVGKDMVFDAIMKVMKAHTFDSASEFLVSLVWDSVPRLDTWLTHTYGVPENEYHRAVGANWIKGLVKRIIQPGSKFDYVLVLEGPQGSKKSTSLAVLGQSWHVETIINTETKDFFMQFSGKAIIEFSEGETLNRTDVKRMKAIITMQADKYRPPYERVSREFPRRCVFAMTTNEEEYLKDETGNRRWFPVKLEFPEANITWLAEHRDQLLAEAYHRVIILKETTYEFPKEESLAAQSARRIHDPNTDLICHWYYNLLSSLQRDEGVTVQQIYKDVLNEKSFSTRPLGKYDEMCIAGVLKESLKLVKRDTMQNGIRAKRWYDDNHIAETMPVYKDIPWDIDPVKQEKNI